MTKYKKRNIVLIAVSVIAFIISVIMLRSSVLYLINILKSPVPIDSFGTVELAASLVVIFSSLVVISVIGIVIGALKLKRN